MNEHINKLADNLRTEVSGYYDYPELSIRSQIAIFCRGFFKYSLQAYATCAIFVLFGEDIYLINLVAIVGTLLGIIEGGMRLKTARLPKFIWEGVSIVRAQSSHPNIQNILKNVYSNYAPHEKSNNVSEGSALHKYIQMMNKGEKLDE